MILSHAGTKLAEHRAADLCPTSVSSIGDRGQLTSAHAIYRRPRAPETGRHLPEGSSCSAIYRWPTSIRAIYRRPRTADFCPRHLPATQGTGDGSTPSGGVQLSAGVATGCGRLRRRQTPTVTRQRRLRLWMTTHTLLNS